MSQRPKLFNQLLCVDMKVEELVMYYVRVKSFLSQRLEKFSQTSEQKKVFFIRKTYSVAEFHLNRHLEHGVFAAVECKINSVYEE